MFQGPRTAQPHPFPFRTAVAALALLALGACQEGGQLQLFQASQDSAPASAGDGRSTRLIERDIEAPDVFQVTEAGLWDGRPSLGGVWVAHPDVTEPERVLIRNTSNDSFVIGALFRRETMGPGPRLQVSSDAAAALDMLAGAPEELNVTALRRETVDPDPVEPAPLPAAAGMPAAAEVEAAPLDPAPGAVEPDATAGDAPEAPEEAQPRKSGGLFGWLRKDRDPQPAPTASATASTAGSLSGAAPAEVSAAPLDAPAPATATAPVAQAAAVSSLDKPYIQLGIFSIQENAQNTATAMRQRALDVSVLTQESAGKTFYRVIAGPAQSTEQRATMLQIVKDAGFTDAYPVTN
ncbi:SPOR domain-containing protein [Ferrimonas balearica]|nr:SPOR domain-containing protein [Ferrimonas balearica]